MEKRITVYNLTNVTQCLTRNGEVFELASLACKRLSKADLKFLEMIKNAKQTNGDDVFGVVEK